MFFLQRDAMIALHVSIASRYSTKTAKHRHAAINSSFLVPKTSVKFPRSLKWGAKNTWLEKHVRCSINNFLLYPVNATRQTRGFYER